MRIEYKILWIDDTPEWVESQVDDIIAVDCNLSDDEKGIDALNLIRQEKIYTEILFYSQTGEQKLREEMQQNNQVEGVYFASRTNFLEKIEKLIDTTIRKTQEINNLRGLVMAETSIVDNLIKNILLKMKWSEEHFTGRYKKLNEYHEGQKKKLSKHLPFDDSKIGLFVHGHFNSMFSFWSLEKFITKEKWDSIKEYENIMHKRNFLAHGKELSSSAEKIIIVKTKSDGSTESLTFTPNDFIELRKKTKDFRKKFEEFLL